MVNEDSSDELVLVLTTEVSTNIADSLAKELLRQKLAACVNLREIRSYFMWEGELEEVKEAQLLIKTTNNQLQNLLEMITDLHSYETPELIHWHVSASDAYMEWVKEVTLPAYESN
ncbi:divalent-cation tolerance protein CutA [Prochlorococcus sp. MIT 1307]|uniref:divalent-cation tolerance protein CutA n=1 Tax=Prochlorococcus sp. MIT 1307 TaxID=3096219 RepID=UPI002A75978B|nr:divalent-cation tolerance protein CutA [Prochlorococcus sp. MIT 1307]